MSFTDDIMGISAQDKADYAASENAASDSERDDDDHERGDEGGFQDVHGGVRGLGGEARSRVTATA